MRVRRAVGAMFVALAIAAPVAGCAESPGVVRARADQEKRAWSEKVCGSFVPLLEIASKPPPQAVANDPVATTRALRDYVAEILVVLDRTTAGLDGAGKSPMAGGDKVVSDSRASLLEVRSTLARLKDVLDRTVAARVATDPAQSSRIARTVASLLTLQNPTSRMSAAGEDLSNQVQNAPSCRSLKDRSSFLLPPLEIPTISLPPPQLNTPTPLPGSGN